MEGISNANEDMLYKEFGVNAELLIDHSKGIEPTTITDIKNYKGKSKSVSSNQILAESYDFNDAKLVLKEMIQNGVYDLSSRHEVCKVVGFHVGYDDKEYVAASTKLTVATNLYSILVAEIEDLFDKKVDKTKKIKALGYSFSTLLPEENEHYDLFTDLDEIEKEKKITNSVIKLKEKYGKNSVLKALDYTPKATIRERNTLIGGHRSGKK